MDFLLTLQKTNFKLASKWFVTTKNPRTTVRGFLLFVNIVLTDEK